MGLGDILRQRRDELDFTLDEISKKTGFSKPYLSTIETRRVKNPPSDDLLVRLEKILKFEPGQLLRIAHLEKMPADIREIFEKHEAENLQMRVALRKMSEGSSANEVLKDKKLRELMKQGDSNAHPTITAGILIPVINQLAAGYPNDYDDKGYPPGGADDYVRCPDLHDPHAFAVRVVGDSMEPKYHEGDIIIFSPAAGVESGHDCFVRMTDPYETTFKQVFFDPNGIVRLQPHNPKYPPMMLPRERVTGIWKAVIRYEHLNG